MAIKLEVTKADLGFEAGYSQPDFSLLKDGSVVLHHLYKRLEPHGLRLTDIRMERGSPNIYEHHIVCYLFNYWMTVRIRVDRVEIVCTELPRDYVEKFKAAILDVLKAIKDYQSGISFRAFAVAVGLHGKLESKPVREFLAGFVGNVPEKLGPSTGRGAAFYFGPEGERLSSTITADMSALVTDAIYLRLHGVWDGTKVSPDSISGVADSFFRRALESMGLQLPG